MNADLDIIYPYVSPCYFLSSSKLVTISIDKNVYYFVCWDRYSRIIAWSVIMYRWRAQIPCQGLIAEFSLRSLPPLIEVNYSPGWIHAQIKIINLYTQVQSTMSFIFNNSSLQFLLIISFMGVNYHDLAPKNRRILSKESQNVRDHGAMRNQQGTKPLYSAKNPSWFIVFIKQSIEFLYKMPEKYTYKS